MMSKCVEIKHTLLYNPKKLSLYPLFVTGLYRPLHVQKFTRCWLPSWLYVILAFSLFQVLFQPMHVLACQLPIKSRMYIPHLSSLATVSMIISAVRTVPLLISSIHLLLFCRNNLRLCMMIAWLYNKPTATWASSEEAEHTWTSSHAYFHLVLT